MKCGYCKYNDGVVYTSIPPQYRCTITNEFHLATDDCNVEFAPVKHGKWINDNHLLKCSICGSPAPIRKVVLRGEVMWEDNSPDNYCPKCGAKMDIESKGEV